MKVIIQDLSIYFSGYLWATGFFARLEFLWGFVAQQ